MLAKVVLRDHYIGYDAGCCVRCQQGQICIREGDYMQDGRHEEKYDSPAALSREKYGPRFLCVVILQFFFVLVSKLLHGETDLVQYC